MVKETVPSLRLTPKRSTLLLSFILIAHLSASAVLLFLPLEFWWQLTILLLITVSLVQAARIHLFRSNAVAINSAEWNSEGEWMLHTANGNELAAQLQVSSYVQPWLIVLNFSISRFQRRSLILLPDAVDPDLLRRLRVRLKLLGAADANV